MKKSGGRERENGVGMRERERKNRKDSKRETERGCPRWGKGFWGGGGIEK